jgi:hypothetical protein
MVYDSLEQNQDPYVYLESIRKTNKEFIQEMLLYFGALTSFGLGGLAVLNNAHTDLEIVAKIFEGSLLQITGGIALNKAWQINKDRRNARKFLSKVRKLNAS